LADRVPANTVALAMKARAGKELECRTDNLPKEHPAQPHGIISYYATLALAEATTMDDWLTRTEALIREDVDAGRLLPDFQDKLCVLGDSRQPAPGKRLSPVA
jgi:hypothetical protein